MKRPPTENTWAHICEKFERSDADRDFHQSAVLWNINGIVGI